MGFIEQADDCPSEAELVQFASDEIADRRALARLEGHLAGCSLCAARLREIRSNQRLLAFIRHMGAQATSGAQPAATGPPVPASGPSSSANHATDAGRALDPAASDERAPLRGYRLLEILHRGGQGTVHRATHEPTGRAAAVKVIRAGSTRERQRLWREAQLVAKLRHPNIVTVHDCGLLPDGGFAIAMELVEGVTLDEWRRRIDAEDLSAGDRVRRKLALFVKVCDAVQHAHQRGVIHRDLKPLNILVDASDEPRVLDFGIAHDATGVEATITRTGEFTGTLAYAAPEQVSSDAQETDTRSDVYSLGVVLYELVAGTMPYDTAGPMESVVNAIAHAEPIPPRTDIFDRRVDADVTTIILKALSKAPDRRYQSAGALGADIARHLAGTVIEARRDSTWYVVRKTASRHKVLLAGAGVVALALLAGAGAAGYGLTRARDARAYEAVERVHAQSEARSARSAGRLVRQLFVPVDVITDEAELGRYVFAGRLRVWTTLKFGALADDPDGEATARSVFASEVLKQDPAAAEGFLRINIASLAKQHGENHPALAEAFHGLAEVLLGRGNRLIEAERSARRAVEIRRALLRGDDPGLAASQHLLARILLARGDAAGAADACEEAVAALRIAGKPNTLELAGAVATRSDIRSALGRAAEAEADAREALVLGLEALVDDDDPFVIECLLRSADLLGAASPTPPEPVLAAALQQPTRAGVADALRAAGHRLRIHGTSAADCLAHAAGLETILSIRTALFDKDDPSVARTAASIAADHYLAVDLPGVDAALRRLLPLLEARLGRDHVALIPAIESLCENLMDLEEFERAAASRRRMLDIWSAQSEPARDDLWLANEHRWLALALAFGGSFAEAEIEYRAAIDGLARAGLVDHYLGDICTGGLGWVALHLGRPDEAEALTRSALERYSSRSGAPRDQLALLQRHLGHVLIARGRLDEAAPLVDAAHASIGLTVGETAPLACTLIDAIELARRRGDVAAVERFCAELAEARRKIRGPSNVEPRAAEAE